MVKVIRGVYARSTSVEIIVKDRSKNQLLDKILKVHNKEMCIVKDLFAWVG